ncbi:uncharacterized protein LOC134276398 [Saccostrea cucullata]|uniref:uncharacterized protein LOC134276398 n=1 Tax=Saccostrea cuccullata TaxID=36930 RepID=UPI002ED13C16
MSSTYYTRGAAGSKHPTKIFEDCVTGEELEEALQHDPKLHQQCDGRINNITFNTDSTDIWKKVIVDFFGSENTESLPSQNKRDTLELQPDDIITDQPQNDMNTCDSSDTVTSCDANNNRNTSQIIDSVKESVNKFELSASRIENVVVKAIGDLIKNSQNGIYCLIKQTEGQIAKTLKILVENSNSNQPKQTPDQVLALKTELSQVKAENLVYKEEIDGIRKRHARELREMEAKYTQMINSCDKEREWKKKHCLSSYICRINYKITPRKWFKLHQRNPTLTKTMESVKKMAEKPKVLLIGTSNVHKIKEEKLSTQFDTIKRIAYTLEDTHDEIKKFTETPDCIVLHSLTNDGKTKHAVQCTQQLEEIINSCKSKWTNIKVVLSLETPRLDDKHLDAKMQTINAAVVMKFMEDPHVTLSHNTNLTNNGIPLTNLLEQDGYHLSKQGTARLAANLRNTVFSVLEIHQLPSQRNNGARFGKRNTKYYGNYRNANQWNTSHHNFRYNPGYDNFRDYGWNNYHDRRQGQWKY